MNCQRPLAVALYFSMLPVLSAADLVATGITEPIADVMLSASVSGIIRAWNFKEGDFVRANDVILELDQDLEEFDATRRSLVMENRKRELDGMQLLLKKNSISVVKEELDKVETEYRIATVEYQIASEQLRRRKLLAPCDGFIVEIARDPGEACQPYQPLVRFVDTRQCYFISNLEAKAASGLKLQQTVTLQFDCLSAPVTVSGTVAFRSPVVDPASGLQRIKVLFQNDPAKIPPGIAGRMLVPAPAELASSQ